MQSNRIKVGGGFSLLVVAVLAFYQSHVIASVTIGVSHYNEISPSLYVDSLFSASEQATIAITAKNAKQRVESQYGEITSTPTIIVSSTLERSARFFPGRIPPGRTYSLPWGQYIPITPEGNNVDVMAHELVHAELFHRLGFFKSLRSLPIWFIEGVAMQVDYREGKAWSYILEGRELPPVSTLETADQFMSGDRALHYAAAKVEVSAWLSSVRNLDLYEFIDEIRNGTDFYEIFDGTDTQD